VNLRRAILRILFWRERAAYHTLFGNI